MGNLPKGEEFLPKTPLKELENLYAHEKKAKPKIRLLCAIHRKNGASIDEIAAITNQNRRTVHAILHRFQERGVNGKDAIKQTGRPAFLTLEQRRNLVRQLERGPPQKQNRPLVHKRSPRIYQKTLPSRIHLGACLGTAQSVRVYHPKTQTKTSQRGQSRGD